MSKPEKNLHIDNIDNKWTLGMKQPSETCDVVSPEYVSKGVIYNKEIIKGIK